jgi:tight adherence protein B
MTAPMLISLAAFVAVVALVLLVALLATRRGGAVRRRLDDHAVAIDHEEARRLTRIQILKKGARTSVSGASSESGNRLVRTAARELETAASSLTVGKYLALRLFIAALALLAALAISGNIIIALPVAVVGTRIPRFVIRRKGRLRLKAFEAQLAEAMDLLVGALRSGHGFLQGLESVAQQMENPVKAELTRVNEEVSVGVNPVDSLLAMSRRIPSYDLALLVSAISVQRQAGGNLAEVLENLAATVRERRRVRGEVHALTTGPRVSAYVLGAIPVLLFLYFVAISSEYRLVMLGTTYGYILLGLAAVLSTLGFIFSRKVAKVEY